MLSSDAKTTGLARRHASHLVGGTGIEPVASSVSGIVVNAYRSPGPWEACAAADHSTLTRRLRRAEPSGRPRVIPLPAAPRRSTRRSGAGSASPPQALPLPPPPERRAG